MAKHGTRVVKRVRVFTPEEFQEQVCRLREPAILCGLDLGCAPAKWSPEYLKSKHSKNAVKIHVCPQQQMDFVNRNFAYKYAYSHQLKILAYNNYSLSLYRTLSFGELVQRCSQKWNSEHFICKVIIITKWPLVLLVRQEVIYKIVYFLPGTWPSPST